MILSSLLLLFACTKESNDSQQVQLSPGLISMVTEAMTDIMVHDITNPPLAARFYAYSLISGNEVLALSDEEVQSFQGLLNEFPEIVPAKGLNGHHPALSSLLAVIETAMVLQPSGNLLEETRQALLDSCLNLGISKQRIKNSEQVANAISEQVLAYAKSDKYNRISNYPRYQPKGEEGFWYPTPPGYFAPVEPYFNTLRPLTLDSPSQFKPLPPAAYHPEEGEPFFEMLTEVYKVELSEENRAIAAFWDCNPFALEESGHLMVGLKQISPGGHWIGITGIACEKADLTFSKAMEIHAVVAIGLMDGFMACWDEKYRSDRIRPESAIRKHMDPSYRPLLQTPPFPEYLSGHSTISTTSAVILTNFFGEGFAFTDTVEEKYGLGTRDFPSFLEAAEEASISRLYGGIHFMDAIRNGQDQGREVGQWVLKSLYANPLSPSGNQALAKD
ncbi:vanadium-dependent haloperoxidase [Pleomorphovibrio marinus]|uniref:vanadium-dependent haloperoxidase n=1 Tax=Pleomorphovibrio marinus TaxID=2164132 RepID=UPI000E0BA4AB|nr:vanadium-dependent haloperoxidase [Pleomorphovibrio marinus]